jgi:hypothetical protein
MGASASLLNEGEWADPSLKELIDTVEQLQFDISTTHRKVLDEQSRCLFKKHDQIITLLTSKTKRQLHNMFTVPDSWTISGLSNLLGGKDYATFLTRLATPHLALKLLDLKTATEGLGADLDILASILCVSTPVEIANMVEYCTTNGFDVNFAISKKTKGFPQMFFLGILNSNRDNNAPDNVEHEVNMLLNSSTESLDDFFSVLVTASYDQLERYDAFLKEKQTTTMNSLEKLVDKKLARNPILKFMKVFLKRSVPALAQIIFNDIRNVKLVTMILTRYEKSYLHEVDICMMQGLHKSGLNHLITSSMRGNVAKCAKCYLVNKTPCNGIEAACEKYIHDYMAQGYDLAALLAWGESCAAIKKFFEEQKTELESYCRTKKIVKAGEHHPDEDVSEYINAPQAYQWDEMPVIDTEGGDDDYDTQLKMVHDHCHQQFYNVDLEHTGVLSTELFWETLYNMPLVASAFTPEESHLMQEWADFGQENGGVVYEDTLRELSESIVGGIINKGVSTVRSLLEASGYSPGVTKRQSMKGDKVSPSLLEYLHDGFDALDHEGKGTLTKTEFWEFISMLNLGLMDHDFDNIMNKWAYGQAEEIAWKDVMPEFADLLHSMCSDNRDHFIGLVDKTSQLGFWYNLRDGSSEWMNDEQNQYFSEQIDAQYYSKSY